MRRFLFLFSLLLLGFSSSAQTDSLLLAMENEMSEAEPLLPERMIFTQRALWGNKGLLRITGISPLTAENREKELKIRRAMLFTHQILGFATLGGMVAQGIVGSQLYKGDYGVYQLHQGLAKGVNAAYFTTAGLSLFTPPPLLNRKSTGWNSIKYHKYLAMVHMTGMITTNVLARNGLTYKERPYHRAAAFSAFGAFAAAMIVIKF